MDVTGKTVLVTGAGGSIGSAICRRLDAMNPGLLVLFELNEYALYSIDQKLSCERIVALGDVKDARRLLQMPQADFVFHCAAYKHVPLLESINAEEGYRNNVLGTECVMQTTRSAQSVVLLSTDKAVNPASVMGRSKLQAESLARHYGRTVGRLGNILESSGSVIPKFREQIAAGGPVTVTHPEATRYFMAMDKAVDFLIGLADREPDTYTASMGAPVNIMSLAQTMIGDKDIRIDVIGLRPGEKLHEELEAA